MPKKQMILTSLTDDEKAIIETAAKEMRQSRSAFIAHSALKRAKEII